MAREFGGDLWNFEDMTDDEIRETVLQQLREYPNLDTGWMDVDVRDGFVTLSGRVGTDTEYQVAEQVLTDVLGLPQFANELVVDELVRGELSEAADEALEEARESDTELGYSLDQDSDTALTVVEDLEAETFGTHDVGEAIQEGTVYMPPDRPVGDGYTSRENH